ncbi:hypothetical protein [Desulfovibrio psychrotolerans]|uniref:Uncharacterized protein n=1 Tax=Desulfovibrio psychrotolerans TaxID=415242 RepID=A0A7J0BX54_9BACT|nr:hypothetical protein [Desulfovibrio psychrotolerans]GFM38278.1 hypothetical protein DSM19430T_29620 [Desulfovibrio psychrotolerans]
MSENFSPEIWTLKGVVRVLEHKAELVSFPVPNYGEQHLSLKLNPKQLHNAGLFADGVPPVHELYVGVPDFRPQLSDRMAATFNACKGIPTKQLEGIELIKPRPLEEYHEDEGYVLWWTFPIEEPPYCGAPFCSDWPGYHTHWTKILLPAEPGEGEQ